MRILITGITGRIGSTLARSLVEQGHQVRGLVWPHDLRLDKLRDLPLELIEGTLTSAADVNHAVADQDIICHLGAAFQGGGPFSHDDYFEINVGGTYHLLEAARVSPTLRHVIFASSDALYDKYIPGGMTQPIVEDETLLAPTGLYSLTKSLGEAMGLGYDRTFNLPLTVLRFALVVAENEILNFGQFYLSHWLKTYEGKTSAPAKALYHQLASHPAPQNTLLLARDEAGRSYKKHIADVHDIVHGIICALNKPEAFGQVFQLAGPRPFTWAEVIPYLAQKLGLEYVDLKLVDQVPTYYEFDLAKSQRLLGFGPEYDIFKMIDQALAFRNSGQATG